MSFLIWTRVFVVYIVWGALGSAFRVHKTSKVRRFNDWVILCGLFCNISVFSKSQWRCLVTDVVTSLSRTGERQRDDSHQCLMTWGAKPEVPASDISRRLPGLYSFIVSGEVFVALICKLWKFKTSGNPSPLSLAGDPQEKEPKPCGHLWKQPFE